MLLSGAHSILTLARRTKPHYDTSQEARPEQPTPMMRKGLGAGRLFGKADNRVWGERRVRREAVCGRTVFQRDEGRGLLSPVQHPVKHHGTRTVVGCEIDDAIGRRRLAPVGMNVVLKLERVNMVGIGRPQVQVSVVRQPFDVMMVHKRPKRRDEHRRRGNCGEERAQYSAQQTSCCDALFHMINCATHWRRSAIFPCLLGSPRAVAENAPSGVFWRGCGGRLTNPVEPELRFGVHVFRQRSAHHGGDVFVEMFDSGRSDDDRVGVGVR